MLSRQKQNLKRKMPSRFAKAVWLWALVFTAPATVFAATSDLKANPIVKDIQSIVNFLSIGVGVVVIGMLIVGGIQYSIAGDNPQAVTAAKQRMINAAIAFVAYLLSFAFLQWVIPGGIFS